MKMTATHRFPSDPQTLWDVFDSDEFERRFSDISLVDRVIVERHHEGDVEIRVRKCLYRKPLPDFVATFLGTKDLSFKEITGLDRKRNRLTWEVVPTLFADRVTIKGSTRMRDLGGTTERVVDGDFAVRVPIIGTRIETAVASGVKDSYEQAAAVALAILKESKK